MKIFRMGDVIFYSSAFGVFATIWACAYSFWIISLILPEMHSFQNGTRHPKTP